MITSDMLKPRKITESHNHRWFFLQARTESIDLGDDTFKKIEYAYFVCNDCPNAVVPELPNVIKVLITEDNKALTHV